MGVMEVAAESAGRLDPSGNNYQDARDLVRERSQQAVSEYEQQVVPLSNEEMLRLILAGVLFADFLLFGIFIGVML